MKKINLGQTISTLANVGVVAGILFLAIEVQQNTQAIEVASAQSFLSTTAALDLSIAENAEIARLITQDPATLDGADRLRAERFRYSALRQWENAHYLYSISALDEEFWLAYRNELIGILGATGRMAAFWRANRSSFTPAFNAELEGMLNEGGIE